MISDGDRLLLGLSGGTDSFTLLCLLHYMKKRAPIHFELYAVTFDPGFPGFAAEKIQEYCRNNHWPHQLIAMNIPQLLQRCNAEERPCVLCSRMRRGKLYETARKLNCNKLVLGHHLDDIAVSFLISLFRGQGMTTMGPNVPGDQEQIRIIRPFSYTPQTLIRDTAAELDFPQAGQCMYHQQLEANGDRAFFTNLLNELEKKIPDVRQKILKSLSDVRPKYLLDRQFLQFE